MLKSIIHGFTGVARFSGRTRRSDFWPYAILISLVALTAIMAPVSFEASRSIERKTRFAAEHPEVSTVSAGPGYYSVRIEGVHPELMPDMRGLTAILLPTFVFVIGSLAAAVIRRLHDAGRTGAWGLLPVPFALFSSVMLPRLFESFTSSTPDLGLFGLLFISNALYMLGLVILVVQLCRDSTAGPNRYGPPNGPTPPL